jgi:DNA-binding NarL/FixJ family response regulator
MTRDAIETIPPVTDLGPEGAVRSERSSDPDSLDDPIRLLIADDDDRTTKELRESLPVFGFEIVGTARGGTEAGERAAILRPEVVLMDLRMPGVNGIEATVLIKARDPRTQVVILTAFLERDSRWTAGFVGATSLVEKNAPLDVLVDTLRAAGLAYRTSIPSIMDGPPPIDLR